MIGEPSMKIARITLAEMRSEQDNDAVIAAQKEAIDNVFTKSELAISIKTGPTSGIALTIYPSKEDADGNLLQREEFLKKNAHHMTDSFVYEGEAFIHKGSISPSTQKSEIAKLNEKVDHLTELVEQLSGKRQTV